MTAAQQTKEQQEVKTLPPTQRGDVLILETERGLKIHAVGPVIRNGQQDFHTQETVKYIKDRAAAMVAARILVLPEGRIFWVRIDTGAWSQVFS
jgi:hypothetical protein